MSTQNIEATKAGSTVVKDASSVYQSLFDKINLTPVAQFDDIVKFQDNDALAEASADERVTMAVNVFLNMVQQSAQKVDKLDKSLLDYHISQIDQQLSEQLDAIMHHPEFQSIESAWRGLKFLVDRTDFRRNVRIEVLDASKEALQQDFEDAPETIQTGFFRHTYIQEYDTPGGEPIGVTISNFNVSIFLPYGVLTF